VTWQQQVEKARSNPDRVVLEGVHALKHAIRFGGAIHAVFSPDPDRLLALLADLAPDVTVPVPVQAVSASDWDLVTRGGLPSPSLAVAARPSTDLAATMATRGGGPVVFLDRPTHLGNVGAVVRVAAASGAAAVVVRGRSDPWHPTAVRGGAGLQFALPVGHIDGLPVTARPLVAVHPDGAPLGQADLPSDAVLAFGTERSGLADDVLEQADHAIRIPMRAGVSSLNLATAAAVVLYHGVSHRDGPR
jgi:RNA methyltransferase, TrmH family